MSTPIPENPVRTKVIDMEADGLNEIMQRCGQAQYDDSSCTFGGADWNRSANSFEAGAALDAVAELLGIPGPSDYYDKLCEG